MPSRPGDFHPSRSQIRTQASQLIRLVPPSEGCRLPLNFGFLPSPVDPSQMAMACSLRSAGITRFLTTTKQSAPSRRIGTFGLAVGAACAFSLGIAGKVLTFRTKLVELRAACTPDAARSVSGHPPSSSRRMGQPPVLTSPNRISTLLQRFAYARLSRPCLPESCSDLSATLTTMAFDHSSLRWLGIGS
jgi:hypothetical protein